MFQETNVLAKISCNMEQLVKQVIQIRLHYNTVNREEVFKLSNIKNTATRLLRFSDIHRLDNILQDTCQEGHVKEQRTEISGQALSRTGQVTVQLTPPSSSQLAGWSRYISVMYGYSPLWPWLSRWRNTKHWFLTWQWLSWKPDKILVYCPVKGPNLIFAKYIYYKLSILWILLSSEIQSSKYTR
jgi:hypothetical protein